MVTREVTVWCDTCTEWEQGVDGLSELRKALRRAGWLMVKGRDICVGCVTSGRRN